MQHWVKNINGNGYVLVIKDYFGNYVKQTKPLKNGIFNQKKTV